MQNKSIFDGVRASVNNVLFQIDYLMHHYPIHVKKKKFRDIGVALDLVFPCGFFDGATAASMGGAGVFIAISSSHKLSLKLGNWTLN